jgi:hypothetical protein
MTYQGISPIGQSPKEVSARARLGTTLARLEGINNHLVNAMEMTSGNTDPPNTTQTGPPTGNIHSLIDHIEMTINSIDNHLEHLSARL